MRSAPICIAFTLLCSAACAYSPQGPPLLVSGQWQGIPRPKAAPVPPTVSSRKLDSLSRTAACAVFHQGLQSSSIFESIQGTDSRSFVQAIVNQFRTQSYQLRELQERELIPGAVLYLGHADKGLLALVQGVDPGGTARALLRSQGTLKQIIININQPHRHRDAQGRVINSVLRDPQGGPPRTGAELLRAVYLPVQEPCRQAGATVLARGDQ